MIVPDLNLLIYAYNTAAPLHPAAAQWWESRLNGKEPVAVPWIVGTGFIRLMTHPRVLENPMTAGQAIARVREWRARPVVLTIEPGRKFADIFFGYLEKLGSAGNLTTDAFLAALAVEHQAELHSNDADFHRFAGLRWRNPLVDDEHHR
ncbi:MAG: type II toxin-antitoxin system VapC family toxin [Opitutales bacterium]|nr:type II toxin-antitoxin system VapC family toxin [Opitutales bacterium]